MCLSLGEKRKRVSVYVCNRKVQKHSTNKLSSSSRSTIASTDTPSLICPPPPDAPKCLTPSKTSDKVGSVSTLLAERLMPNGLSDAEATFLALRIHADTGSLCYESTTPRDAKALAWLMDQGACQADISAQAKSTALLPSPSNAHQLLSLLPI